MNRIMGLVLSCLLLVTGQVFAEGEAVDVGNKLCPVSGEPVTGTEMEGVSYEYNGKLYHFCCASCIPDFKKDPEKYSKIAEDEVAKSL